MSHFPRTIEYLIGIYFPQDAYNYYDHTILCKRVQYYARMLLVLLLLFIYYV